MHIPHETQNRQKAGSSRKPIISIQWVALLIFLFILLLAGIFANYHPPLSAGGIKTTELELVPRNEGGQSQENEKMARNTDKLANTPSIWPTSGTVSSGFGWRNPPLEGASELHQGIDIANNIGTPVVATADGTIVKSGWSGGYGNIVQIDHGNGIETIYGHNSQIVVSVGQSVKKGQLISYIGSTGTSTGPHVHYEVREKGSAVDPLKYMVRY